MLELPNSFSVKDRLPSGSDSLRAMLEPLPARSFLAVLAGGVAVTTIYCQLWCMIAFGPFRGMPMPLEASFVWALGIVPPWLIAFELGKRSAEIAPPGWQRGLVITATFLFATTLSIVLELGFDGLSGQHTRSLPLQIAAQIPVALLTCGALALRRLMPAERPGVPAIYSDDLADLVAGASRIEWIKAAGNYVEARQGGRTRLYRVTMQTLEHTLDPSRFVRIHRQVIVNAAYVDRDTAPASGNAIRLMDGTVFKIGGRYEPNWRSVAGRPISSVRH